MSVVIQIRFNPDLLELIPADQLDAVFGGTFEYEFEPESYWSQIVEYEAGFSFKPHPQISHCSLGIAV